MRFSEDQEILITLFLDDLPIELGILGIEAILFADLDELFDVRRIVHDLATMRLC